jgi:hypothetical protein
MSQIRILEKLNDEIKKNKVPFLVGYEEFFRVENELIIIMEYCEGSTTPMQRASSRPTSKCSKRTTSDSTRRS